MSGPCVLCFDVLTSLQHSDNNSLATCATGDSCCTNTRHFLCLQCARKQSGRSSRHSGTDCRSVRSITPGWACVRKEWWASLKWAPTSASLRSTAAWSWRWVQQLLGVFSWARASCPTAGLAHSIWEWWAEPWKHSRVGIPALGSGVLRSVPKQSCGWSNAGKSSNDEENVVFSRCVPVKEMVSRPTSESGCDAFSPGSLPALSCTLRCLQPKWHLGAGSSKL